MAGRDSMAMPGASSYYIQQRNIAGPASGTPTGAQGPTVIRPLSNPSPSLPIQTSLAGGGTIGSYSQVETSSLVAHSGNAGGSGGEAMKRKRGRPRKYGPDGTVSLALSPVSSATPGSGSSSPGQKRGRGRPPGTGRKQQLAALGEWVAGSAGMGFTPHVITIPVGEDIATKIMSFSQQGPRAVCILSANGAVSTVTLRQPATSGGTVTYEGRFEILCLSGSYLLSDDGGSRSRSGGLSISLSSPDGRVIGGGVGGMLIAATPVQVIVGSFIYGGTKAKNKTNTGQESGPEPELPVNDKQSTPSSALGNQNLTASSVMGGWPVSRQLDMRSPHIDINLTRG